MGKCPICKKQMRLIIRWKFLPSDTPYDDYTHYICPGCGVDIEYRRQPAFTD